MLFPWLISPNLTKSCVKNRGTASGLKILKSLISLKVQLKVTRDKSGGLFRRSQCIIGLFLFLFGGIGVDAFAANTKKTNKSSNNIAGSVTSPFSGVMGLAFRDSVNNHKGKKDHSQGRVFNRIRNIKVNSEIQGVIENAISPTVDDNIKSAAESLKLELKEKVLSDGLSVSQVIDLLEERISGKKSDPHMREVEIRIMGQFLSQGVPSDPVQRRRIAFMIIGLFTDEHTDEQRDVRRSVVKVTASQCLSWDILSNPERLDVFYKIVERIFDESGSVGRSAERGLKSLWKEKAFPTSEKVKILSRVAANLPKAPRGRASKALLVIWSAVQIGIPVDFNILNNVMSQVSVPGAGTRAERIIRAFLHPDEDGLSGDEKLWMGLELERQVFIREFIIQQRAEENGTCQESLTAENRL